MQASFNDKSIQHIVAKEEIRDSMCLYARGVDRGDWKLVRSSYHPDAYDDHGGYKGNIDGLIHWLDERFAGVNNSMHFLGNCMIEFAGPEVALVETYFVSRRLLEPVGKELDMAGPTDAMCREAWGRYVDRFELREGAWKVANRTVVLEASSTSLALGGRLRSSALTWGLRNSADRLYQVQAEIFPARA